MKYFIVSVGTSKLKGDSLINRTTEEIDKIMEEVKEAFSKLPVDKIFLKQEGQIGITYNEVEIN